MRRGKLESQLFINDILPQWRSINGCFNESDFNHSHISPRNDFISEASGITSFFPHFSFSHQCWSLNFCQGPIPTWREACMAAGRNFQTSPARARVTPDYCSRDYHCEIVWMPPCSHLGNWMNLGGIEDQQIKFHLWWLILNLTAFQKVQKQSLFPLNIHNHQHPINNSHSH